MTAIKTYNPARKAYLSHELFDKYRYNLSLHGHKLLLGLAQSLDVTDELFPTWHIDIRNLFKYLNVENSNQRYTIVKDAFSELSKNPIEWKVSETRWGFMSWLSFANFDENNDMFVNMKFNPDVKPFLLQLRQFCELETRHYIQLSSDYSMWLYSHLKNAAKKGTHIVTIDRLKEITYTESLKSYNPALKSDATRNFLKNVIGIQRNVKEKKWEPATRKDKKTGEMIPYGAMHEINKNTDLEVSFDVIKKDRVYDRVKFTINFKESAKEARKEKSRKAVKAEVDRIPGDKWITFPYAEAVKMAIEAKVPIEKFLSDNGYTISKNKQLVCKLRNGDSKSSMNGGIGKPFFPRK